jgi:hypothetical protein
MRRAVRKPTEPDETVYSVIEAELRGHEPQEN